MCLIISTIILIFSIHALLAESDSRLPINDSVTLLFYPRSPCGERLKLVHGVAGCVVFLSTLSLRRATM